MILGGDLGGTKTLLALAEVAGGRPTVVREERLDSRAYPRFEDLLAAFLRGQTGVQCACFGLAGPTAIDGRSGQLTNLPWKLDAPTLEKAFGIGQVILANDFATAAHGLELLEPGQIATLQTGLPVERAPRVILGAGTGLGVAGLVWQDGRYRVIPGEGGHMGFAPHNLKGIELWRWLFDQYGRATVEDIVSGPGLARVYRFLSGVDKTPAEVGDAALAGTDPLAVEALEFWLSAYGAFAGDLAMKWLAYGGVFIAGGVAAKLMPRAFIQPFLEAFNAKREHRHIAEAMPIHLVTEERLGLLGAIALAADQIPPSPTKA
ncbi:MAG: glucokinase [Rhodocyclaceae bacterium]|nr:glucokinase [Rhodocyclaceae bacterium]